MWVDEEVVVIMEQLCRHRSPDTFFNIREHWFTITAHCAWIIDDRYKFHPTPLNCQANTRILVGQEVTTTGADMV